MALEDMPKVKFFLEQPTTIEYLRNGKNFVYTPDFAVFLDNNEVFIAEIKDFSGMMDCRVHRKFEALIEFCKKHGLGLILTNGKYTLNKLLKRKYNIDFENELLNRLDENGGRTIFFNEFKELQTRYNDHWIEFLTIVLKNNIGLYPFPFKLSRINNYKLFRETIIKTTQ